MNCKQGDLAMIVRAPRQLDDVLGRPVRIKRLPPFDLNGEPAWFLEEQLSCVLPRGGYDAKDEYFGPGTRVWFDTIQDKYLRPIRDPGDDAVDETLLRTPVPPGDEVPA